MTLTFRTVHGFCPNLYVQVQRKRIRNQHNFCQSEISTLMEIRLFARFLQRRFSAYSTFKLNYKITGNNCWGSQIVCRKSLSPPSKQFRFDIRKIIIDLIWGISDHSWVIVIFIINKSLSLEVCKKFSVLQGLLGKRFHICHCSNAQTFLGF